VGLDDRDPGETRAARRGERERERGSADDDGTIAIIISRITIRMKKGIGMSISTSGSGGRGSGGDDGGGGRRTGLVSEVVVLVRAAGIVDAGDFGGVDPAGGVAHFPDADFAVGGAGGEDATGEVPVAFRDATGRAAVGRGAEMVVEFRVEMEGRVGAGAALPDARPAVPVARGDQMVVAATRRRPGQTAHRHPRRPRRRGRRGRSPSSSSSSTTNAAAAADGRRRLLRRGRRVPVRRRVHHRARHRHRIQHRKIVPLRMRLQLDQSDVSLRPR